MRKKRQVRFGHSLQKGVTKSPHYKRWSHMRSRCYVSTSSEYFRYGEKGIRVCDEWIMDFYAYEKYILSLPNAGKPTYTVDRIDSEGNYEPGNLRWASKTTQSQNCRISSNNKSGHTGVCWHKVAKKWRTYIMVNRKHIHIGMFTNKSKAVAARKEAEIKYGFKEA